MFRKIGNWVAETAAWMREELLSWAFKGFLTALFGVALAAAIVKFGASAPTGVVKPGGTIDWLQAFAAVGQWLLGLLAVVRFRTLLELLLIVTFAAALMRGVLSLFNILRRALQRREAIHNVGLSDYWAHWRAPNRGGPWREICRRISDHNNRILYILGASGIATFGRAGSPLFELMQSFDGEIRIFLLDPSSKAVEQRSRDINQGLGSYRDEIRASLAQIKRWKRTNPNITVKLYDWLPNWKLILTSDMVWLQYYRPQKSVEETPIYQFFSNQNHSTLYHPYYFEFVKLWASKPEHVP